MGEVYRADDLKLGQAVALKFLPQEVAYDEERMDLLYNEVRLARAVSHPNVCRVYDVGEVDGHHFLSMEFIDGEDLGSLLRRIGRLPSDKGVEFARQICGGLYAAHEKGVIHLDLKPSNIMIDGRGKVRITDFGLARLTEAAGQEMGVVGTPAYMAPEQLAGGAVGEHSDIYSLGLIFHEIFTGKPVYRASSVAELIRVREQVAPSRLSGILKELDPAVDTVIQKCLEKDPAQRPASVVQIAAALPGGDPLAAALAAGETPSPELVAASGATNGCSVLQGLSLLGLFVLLMVTSVILMQGGSKVTHSPMALKPAVLEAKAREFSERLLGVPAASIVDSGYGYWYNPDQMSQVTTELRKTGDGAVEFWYRESPRYLIPNHPFLYARHPRVLTLSDPAPDSSGMVGVRLTAAGLLREISIVPSLINENQDKPEEIAEQTLQQAFTWAGLDFQKFESAPNNWTPPWYSQQSFAWVRRRTNGEEETTPIRVEAATRGGKICYFQVIHPWTSRQWTMPTHRPAAAPVKAVRHVKIGELAQDAVFFMIGGPLLVISLLLAVQNLKNGSTDKSGALKYATFMLITDFLLGLFEAHHNTSLGLEMTTLLSCLINSLGRTVRFWIYYLALEPYVRKIWPRVLVSWNRFINGRIGAPSVAKELMVGCICGALSACFVGIAVYMNQGAAQSLMSQKDCLPEALLGGQRTVAAFLSMVQMALPGVFTLTVIVVFRLVLRLDVLAVVAFVAVFTYIGSGSGETIWSLAALTAIQLTAATVALRFGLLALLMSNVTQNFLTRFPVTFDTGEWYFSSGLIGMGIPLFTVIVAFFLALGEKSPLRMASEWGWLRKQ